MKRSPIRRKARKKVWRRKPSDFARIYGSRARARWVKSRECFVCGAVPCDNAHYRTGGTGRKADFTTIVPLCRPHHQMLHRIGIKSFDEYLHTNIAALAESTERRWQEHLTKRVPQPPKCISSN